MNATDLMIMKCKQRYPVYRFRPLSRFIHLLSISLFGLLAAISLPAQATLQHQRDLFQQAYRDLQAGEVSKVKPLLADLRDYPLYPWLEYEFLLQRLGEVGDNELQAFAERYPNSLMSDRIYERWAKRLAITRDWTALLQYIPAHLEDSPTLQCLRAEALIHTGAAPEGFRLGQSIWHDTDRALPVECDTLVVELEQAGMLNSIDVWKRIEQLIRKNQVTAARELAKKLGEDEQELVELWVLVRKDPKQYLPRAFKHDSAAHLREIVVYGIERAADIKLDMAKTLWDDAQKHFKFTPAERGEVDSVLGRWEAWRHDERGLQRLKAIPDQHRSDIGNVWMARMALRFGHWDTLLQAINAMGPEEAERDIWRYWKARALEQTGQQGAANTLLTGLADNTTFYGFLAADRLGQAYARLREPVPDRSQRIAGLKKVAAIQRWQEWMALDNSARAREEWFRTLQAMDKEGMLAAAELATQYGDANLAIWTVSQTRDWNIVDLRFPLLYSDLVLEQSREQGIRPEWVLGVMRRESAFNANAESHAKALGLMQLMPATARDVGKQLGMKVDGRDDILQPETNVQLGSAYLRGMLSRFSGNYAQATAACNAGPQRINKWAPEQVIAPDQWVESIPFDETRRYVRAVMAYTTIYDYKLNAERGGSLSMHLKPVGPE
ncbi:MAG: transglycosylase SLT domain-containing protein [Thiolinea sp.]